MIGNETPGTGARKDEEMSENDGHNAVAHKIRQQMMVRDCFHDSEWFEIQCECGNIFETQGRQTKCIVCRIKNSRKKELVVTEPKKGDRIRFLKELTQDANGETPAVIFCRKGDLGTVEGKSEFTGRYSVFWDGWKHAAFYCDRNEFELVGCG
jgi:hypothetical protein